MNNHQAVIGLAFGDEGKGLVTNYLCLQNPGATVVRYSGGQQAGHTVVMDGKRHVFSNFGSGTLRGNPTYWSKYCTLDPIGIYNELQILLGLGITPILYIDAKCPVTTPIDKIINSSNLADGTCGVGVGNTLQREEKFYSLLFEDLFYPSVVDMKLDLFSRNLHNFVKSELEPFLYCVNYITKSPRIKLVYGIPNSTEGYIFEGSQGLLLDQHYGFFPHVTRSNTGTTNIIDMGFSPDTWCVTRAYQTRHGNGPMTNRQYPHNFKLNPNETNIHNKYQGEFKISILDLDLLKYGLSKDPILNTRRDNLVITCLDQVQDDFTFTEKGIKYNFGTEEDFILAVMSHLGFEEVYLSHSDKSENLDLF